LSIQAWPALTRLKKVWRDWQALAAWERQMLVTMALLMFKVKIQLHLLGFRNTFQSWEGPVPCKSIIPPPISIGVQDFAHRCATLSEIAGRKGLIQANCLHRSLVLGRILRRYGLPAAVRIGTQGGPRPFQAHAWVELEGTLLGPGQNENYQAFEQLASIGGKIASP
jgi:hypothetical protein